MELFASLYEELDATRSNDRMVDALCQYFDDAEARDAGWVVYFLTGRRLKKTVGRKEMRRWARERAGVQPWLFDECYATVGDTAEAIALLLQPYTDGGVEGSVADWAERLLELRSAPESVAKRRVTGWWCSLPVLESFLLTKMLTGAFRVGVSEGLVVEALASWSGVEKGVVEHRLQGEWSPSASFFEKLVDSDTVEEDVSRPYPFLLAVDLESADDVGSVSEYWLGWKFDGVRAQVVKRDGEVWVWSRRDELLTEYPEVVERAAGLPDGTVLDGEVVAWDDGVLTFGTLQRRMGRENPSRKIRREAPVRFIAFDCLEYEGEDVRERTLRERRSLLEDVADDAGFLTSDTVTVDSWEGAAALVDGARDRGVEGLLVKRLDSSYVGGRKRGFWWKWKADPLELDTVLLYAQMGHGKRGNLFSDYTLGVWDGDELVPVAKAYSGLSDEELEEMDTWIRENTAEKYGPVRSVPPEHVFELQFDGIIASEKKAGVSLRFPRINRWRRDLSPRDADSLDYAHDLLRRYGDAPEETDASLDEFM